MPVSWCPMSASNSAPPEQYSFFVSLQSSLSSCSQTPHLSCLQHHFLQWKASHTLPSCGLFLLPIFHVWLFTQTTEAGPLSLPESTVSPHCHFSAILSLISAFQSLPPHQPIHSSRTVSLSDEFDHVILSPCPSNLWKPSIIYKYKFRWCGMSFQVLVLFLFQPLFLPFLSICAFSKVYSKECKNLRGAPLLKSFRVRTRTTQPTLSHSWIVKMSVSTF